MEINKQKIQAPLHKTLKNGKPKFDFKCTKYSLRALISMNYQ